MLHYPVEADGLGRECDHAAVLHGDGAHHGLGGRGQDRGGRGSCGAWAGGLDISTFTDV